MAMHNRTDVRTHAIDRRVNMSFEVGLSAPDDLAGRNVEVEDVVLGDERRRHRSTQQEVVGTPRFPNADVAPGIDDSLVSDDRVREREFRPRAGHAAAPRERGRRGMMIGFIAPRSSS